MLIGNPPPWSGELEPVLQEFCREQVLAPWEQTLQVNRGEWKGQKLSPFMGMGPSLPAWALAWVFHPRLLHTFLGPEPNMVTIILNRAHNRIVFLAAERAEEGKFLEMLRLEQVFPDDLQQKLCRMLQAGAERDLMDALHSALHRHHLGRFRPGLIKVADLYFFDAFLELYNCRHRPLHYAAKCLHVAHQVITMRSLYFYPKIPLENLLSNLRFILPKPRYKD